MSDFNYLHSLIHIALVQLFRGDFDRARSLIDESLAAGERSEAEQRSAAGVTLHARLVLGWMQLVRGESADAREAMAMVVEAARGSITRPIEATSCRHLECSARSCFLPAGVSR